MRKIASLVMVSALVVSACGGGDDDAGSGSGGDWCALAQRIEDSSESYEAAFEAGGQSLGDALDDFSSLLNDAKGSAPNEISDAVDTASEGIERFGELLGEVDYDLFAMSDAAFAELEEMGDEMDAATEQIEAYNLRECGIEPESDDEPSAELPADDQVVATTGPATVDDQPAADDTDDDMADDDVTGDDIADDDMTDGGESATFTGDPDSPWCVTNRQLDELDEELETLFFAEPEVLEAKLGELIGQYEAAANLAPPELTDDVAVSLATIKQLEAALIEADYDFLNADLSVLDEDGAGQLATLNIEAYNEQVCGIPADGVDPVDDLDDGDDDSSGFDPGAGTILEQTIAELVGLGFTQAEAECVIGKIDFTDPELGSDPGTMIAVFDECGIDLARLAELGG